MTHSKSWLLGLSLGAMLLASVPALAQDVPPVNPPEPGLDRPFNQDQPRPQRRQTRNQDGSQNARRRRGQRNQKRRPNFQFNTRRPQHRNPPPVVYNPTHEVGVAPPDPAPPFHGAGTITMNGHTYEVPEASR